MGYLLAKFFTIVFGINKALAQSRFGGTTPDANSQGGTYELPNPLHATNIAQIINNITYYLSVYIAPPLVAIMILVAAFQILTSGGSPEKLKTAKEIILWTVIGYGIILISWGITSIIQQLLTGF